MKDVPISSLARPHVWSVGPDDPVSDVARQMVERHLTWVPVLDGEELLLGVLSAWDLLRLNLEGKPDSTPAWQACTYAPLTVAPETSAREVGGLMRERHVHHVLVMTAQRKVVGVVSSLDLLDPR